MLVTPRGRTNGLMFVVGWLLGLAVVGVVGLTVASAAGASDQGNPSDTADTIQIVLGAALVVFAVRQWRKRPKPGEQPALPKWMTAVDHFGAFQATTLGVVLSAVNPKNLLLSLAAATTIATSNLPGGDQALVYVVYGLIATVGVAAPIVVSFSMGDRAASTLDGLKTWLAHNNAAIMSVIFLVIGGKVLGQGIAG